MPRRSGKDITALNYMIRQMWKKPGVYFYVFPSYAQAKKVIWDSITTEGIPILSYFPKELVLQTNSQEMKIRMISKGGKSSVFQLVGSDNYDSLVGTNPIGCVFSEYALQDPTAYQYLRPILTANRGWALFVSTPRGKNSLWTLYQLSKKSPDWFSYRVTLDDTKHIPMEEIEKERREGIMSEDMIQQEYFVSFDMGVEGSYYSKYIDKMKREERISCVPWESSFKVHTAWDLGVRDKTSIIFFQNIGKTIRIIDCYENSKEGLEHYAELISSKPYLYGSHIAPNDIRVREWGSGITRFEKARQLGINFTVAPVHEISDGIEACRSLFSKLWIDEDKCKDLVDALENYRQEFDTKKRTYRMTPLHDWSSHFCFLGNTLISTEDGYIQIKDISIGQKVKTPFGLRKVVNKFVRKTNMVSKLESTDSYLYCSAEHKIFSSSGLIRADALKYNDVLISIGDDKWNGLRCKEKDSGFKENFLSAKMNAQFVLKDIFIDGTDSITAKQSQLLIRTHHYKELYGKSIMVKFLKNIIFTIKTTTQKIIKLKILSVCHILIIRECICLLKKEKKCLEKALKLLGKRLKSGMDLKKALNGIDNMLRTLISVRTQSPKYASCVKTNIPQKYTTKDFAADLVSPGIGTSKKKTTTLENAQFVAPSSSVIDMLEKQRVKRVVPLKLLEEQEVFDLEVEKDHCYYANGILVSNCDSFRYLSVSLPKTSDSLTAEEIEAQYQEAMFGSDSSLPDFFKKNNTGRSL